MSCRPVTGFQTLPQWRASPSDGSTAAAVTRDVYLCDRPDEFPLIAASNPSPVSVPPVFKVAPPVRTLPEPPVTPMARTLYDLATQLENFELTATVRIPVEGLSKKGAVDTITTAVLGDQGALVALEVEFKPFWGPIPLVKPLTKVPIIGPFFQVKVLRLGMDPQSRRLTARVCYVVIPFNKEVHDLFLEKAQLGEAVFTGPGYDLRGGFPLYSWQAVDIFLKALEEKGGDGLKKSLEGIGTGVPRPLFDQGELLVEGNFSNRSVSFQGMAVNFAPLAIGQKHRIRIAGRLMEPVVTIHGLESAELKHPQASMRLSNTGQNLEPLEIRIKRTAEGPFPVSFEVARYQSSRFLIETLPAGKTDLRLKVELKEGIDIQGATLRLDASGPHIDIRRMAVRNVAFDGGGVHLRTTSGDEAVFEEVRIGAVDGRPSFRSRIRGQGSGEANYFMRDEELGSLKFLSLHGDGDVRVERAADGRAEVEINGRIKTEMPELNLVVRSDKLQAFARTEIQDATVEGTGRLLILPETSEILIEGLGGEPVQVRGRGGRVHLHQDPSQVEGWPELQRELGVWAADVQTDFHIGLKEIAFDFQRMRMRSLVQPRSGKPGLEVEDSSTGPVMIQGDLWGRIFVRIPGGFYVPIVIPESAMMVDASVQIGQLTDRMTPQGRHEIDFSRVFINGEESQPTFSPKDQKRCGADRQILHAVLDLFNFSPEDRRITIKKSAADFHVVLKNQVGGGCVIVK